MATASVKAAALVRIQPRRVEETTGFVVADTTLAVADLGEGLFKVGNQVLRLLDAA